MRRSVFVALVGTLAVLVLMLFMWQVGTIYPVAVTATGFNRIKPWASTIGLSHTGEFIAMFVNNLETPINVKDVMIRGDNQWDISCVGDSDVDLVNPRENFTVRAQGCVTGNQDIDAGDIYHIKVTLEYELVGGDITKTYEESGTIRGAFE